MQTQCDNIFLTSSTEHSVSMFCEVHVCSALEKFVEMRQERKDLSSSTGKNQVLFVRTLSKYIWGGEGPKQINESNLKSRLTNAHFCEH